MRQFDFKSEYKKTSDSRFSDIPDSDDDLAEVVIGCKTIVCNENKDIRRYAYDYINGSLPKTLDVFMGRKVGDVVEISEVEWKIEDIVF